MKTLLVEDQEGKFRIQVPDDAKMTFGPAVPFVKKNELAVGNRGYALRIYNSSKDNPIAVFTGVRCFREANIVVEREVLRESGKTVWRSDEHGFKVESQGSREWVAIPDRLQEKESELPPAPTGDEGLNWDQQA